jgi:hypothetical protein
MVKHGAMPTDAPLMVRRHTGRASLGRRAGPVLAADHTGLWMDFGTTRHPVVIHLAWPEITAARLANWISPAGRQITFLCFDAPGAADAVRSDATIALRTQTAIRTFRTPFAVSDRAKDVDLRTMAVAVRRLAGAAGVDTSGIVLV